jgi:hypothetical protein
MFNMADFGLDPNSRRARIKRMGIAVASAWKAEAQEAGLKSTLRHYKRGVVIREIGDSHVVVALEGELPNLLEHGIAPHDMRTYLLKTVRPGASPIRKVKSGKRKGEPYRYIMFKRSMADIKKMGGSVKGSRNLTPSLSSASGKLLYGSKMNPGQSRHYVNLSGVRSVSDATAGMVKLVGTTTAEGASRGSNTTYAVWRTVSTKRAEAWRHPGYKALHLAKKIEASIPSILETAGL